MDVHRVVILFLTKYILGIYASYHWKVTENGRISSQVENSGFPLRREDDLIMLLEQEHRLQAISKLYKQLMLLKKSIDEQWIKIEREGDLEKRLYSSDFDCLLGEVPLNQHNLNTEFLDYGQGSRPTIGNNKKVVEPDCSLYSKLDFSMRTFPHLETLNKKSDFNLTVNFKPQKVVMNFNIDAMLRVNSSDWTAYNIASHYWRSVGNGTNALECAKRALYFSPRNQRYIVLLNLGTLLQELHSLGEAAIVLHSAVDHDPVQYVSHLALGNVYAALGDYKRSLACYENVLTLNPDNVRALQLKHALLCHKKLENGLLEIHSSLQKILKDLQKHSVLHEEWLHLQNQVTWERNGRVREFFSFAQPIYINLQMLLENVEHQAKTLNEEMSKRVPKKPSRNIIPVHEENVGRRRLLSGLGDESSVQDKKTTEPGTVSLEVADDDESALETFVSSDHLFTNKMGSLFTFIQANYEENINLIDFKKKINEEFDVLSERSQFSLDGQLLFSHLDSCVKESSNLKKLN